ncbi:unnamed protein product [Lampetra planeri]
MLPRKKALASPPAWTIVGHVVFPAFGAEAVLAAFGISRRHPRERLQRGTEKEEGADGGSSGGKNGAKKEQREGRDAATA